MRKRRLGADQPDHERQGVRQRHRLGVAVTCRYNNRTVKRRDEAYLAHSCYSGCHEGQLREITAAARAIGKSIKVVNANSESELEAAFAALAEAT